MNDPRFQIGQRYVSGGKSPRRCTVVDIERTFNSAGVLVKIEYVEEHEFMGQQMRSGVCDTTVAKGVERMGREGW